MFDLIDDTWNDLNSVLSEKNLYNYQSPAGRRKNVPVSSQPIAGILSASSEWNLRYNELIDYRNEHGDLLVPELYKDNR